ncbi:hypothetical protein Leryth_009817 [Lithospermum erythrorhizon]|nr:hypothetical protein Leryth_009817 [Lithospermum erythrorhizon]
MLLFWRFKDIGFVLLPLFLCLVYQDLSFCWCLNDEGVALLRFKERVKNDPFGALSSWKGDAAQVNPCSWFGVGCSNGNVVLLELKDLCLKGTLAPDLANLVHVESISLRNNSFSGIIPDELSNLNELKVLDLRYNNFSVPLPVDMVNKASLAIMLLENAKLSETNQLQMVSKIQGVEDQLSTRTHIFSSSGEETERVAPRKLLQADSSDSTQQKFSLPRPSPLPPRPSVKQEPPPYRWSRPKSRSSAPAPAPSPSLPLPPWPSFSPSPSPSPSPLLSPARNRSSSPHLAVILSAAIGGSLLILIILILVVQRKKVAAVKPWVTGLSGQLQKAFVTGVPSLKRSEIEAACEGFSNVIGVLSVGNLYKGTLSSGVEIAVVSFAVESAKDWSKYCETQIRRKIETLSKLNHKNFVNLLGYCEEETPFTRMIVFEYAPNGTLFEHLHIREAEHLNWEMRMRIVMGIAYCLEYMHQLTPQLPHKNLSSSAIYLTEDYAAKISDFAFPGEVAANIQSNIYSFGVMLFEIITGKLPFFVDNGSPEDWASDYLQGIRDLREMVDPTLASFQEEQLTQLSELIKSCVNPEAELRPSIGVVTARLREITEIGPDGAIPKLSPLWWAELEILSTEVD